MLNCIILLYQLPFPRRYTDMKLIPIWICLLASIWKKTILRGVWKKIAKKRKCSNNYSNRPNRSVTVLAAMSENFNIMIILLTVFSITPPLAKGYETPCIYNYILYTSLFYTQCIQIDIRTLEVIIPISLGKWVRSQSFPFYEGVGLRIERRQKYYKDYRFPMP